MIIKKYIVSDMKEALVRAKYELGGDAVIVNQRPIKVGNWFNPFRRKRLEVTVALEEFSTTKTQKTATPTPTITITPKLSLLDAIDADPIYKNSSDKIKNQLFNYCKLHGKTDHYLTLDEKKDFFKIVLRQNCFDQKFNLCKINVLVGPTGVGKTTTIAKIAAREYLNNKKKVGLITMDTYRIGAVEQLKTYANILGIPFEVVNEPGEMLEKLNLLKNCDVILIDTLGTSPKDLKRLEEIKRHLQAIEQEMNTYLVLSISTDKDTIVSILNKYKELRYDALVITKLDELSNITNLLYFIENHSSPIQFFCHGQDVPDDIQEATLDNLFDYCEENFLYDGSSK